MERRALEAGGGSDSPRKMTAPPSVYTLGHGLIGLDVLMDLLQQHSVELVVDVRSQPFSGRAPQFNREALGAALDSAGVTYRWVPELGGRPEPSLMTPTGRPDYERMAQEP